MLMYSFRSPIRAGLFRRWLPGLLVASSMFVSSFAALQVPYQPDPSTLHLWHLDDSNGLTAEDAISLNGITLTNLGMPTPGTPPYTNTSFGSPAFPGLGTSVSGTTRQHLLYGGAFTDVLPFSNPETGAFTFEALLKFDTDPLGAIDAEIVSGDNAAGIGSRGWQWRIFNGVMEWDLLAGSTDNDFKANLPATGPNAAVTGTWYHAAITYSGFNPTNGEPANVITFYWTLLDANRTNAEVLGTFTATRPLDGAPQGQSQPSLGVGGSARNITGNPGNNEGIIGSIDEVRISDVARRADEMAFISGGTANPPSFTTQPPASTLVGYGQTLTLAALVSGTPPLEYQWQLNGTNIPGQNQSTLVLPGVTFTQAGAYQLAVTNASGGATSRVAQVTVGAAPTGLFNTGLDTNGVVSAGNIPDPHWTLARSSDPAFLGPDAMIFEYNFPIQFADPNGAFSPTNGLSMWIGPSGNPGGSPQPSPAGDYVYRATFLLDSADPGTVSLSGNLWANGSITNVLVNGKSTGITLAPGGTLYVTTFSITNGFVAGLNTVDFVENLPSGGISGLRVEIRGVGQALPPGAPVIVTQPADQTVRDAGALPGSKAIFSTAAIGRPPLSYQWWADGAALTGATNRVLTVTPSAGAQGTNFSVVVSNDSGSVTSRVAVLTVVQANQPPVPAPLTFITSPGTPIRVPLSDLLQISTDPDHDPITFTSADTTSTNGATVEQIDAYLVYTPVEGFEGRDQFGYTISDPTAAAQGQVTIQVGGQEAPTLTATLGNNGNLVLNWSGAFTLEASENVAGPWTAIATNVPGPFNVSTAGAARQFFRLVGP